VTIEATGFYQTGGTLRHDAPSYVERRADTDLYEGLSRGEFCYVLTARQMGKSSLMVHTATRLRLEGTAVASLDLTGIGQNLTAEQWYDGLLNQIGQSLDLEDELEEFWLDQPRLGPLQRWLLALREVLLARVPGRIVIFIDEIDAVRSLSFSTDEFFAGIRECYNRRTQDPEFTRLTFCLLGVASPSDLIRDTRTTPFNIGRRIELTDFAEEEAAPLAAGLAPSTPDVLRRILYWTNGHPYLTQRLCQAVVQSGNAATGIQVDRLCEELYLSPRAQERDDNLLYVRERLLRPGAIEAEGADVAGLLELFAQVRRGRRVRDDETNPLVTILRLSGIVRATNGFLAVRNRIYAHVFDARWVEANMPDAELRRQRAAYRRGLLRAAGISGVIVGVVGALAFQAVRQSRVADGARRLAQAGQRDLRHTVYAAQVNLAQQALEAANVSRARELLEAQQPVGDDDDLRGFEWRYLWRQAHRDDATSTFRPHEAIVSRVAFSPDGKTLATSSWDGTVKLWDRATRKELRVFRGHKKEVWAAVFSPNGRKLASCSSDGTIRLWDIATGRGTAVLKHGGTTSDIAFSPDGRMLVAGGERTNRRWALTGDGGAPIALSALPGHSQWSYCVAFSPDGRTLATGGSDQLVRLWDTRTWRSPGVLAGMGDFVWSLTFSPDGRTLAAGGVLTGKSKIWDLESRRVVGTPARHRGGQVFVAFSPDGKQLATGGQDYTVRLWNLRSQEEEGLLLGHTNALTSIAYSPDGQLLASSSWDQTVRFWKPRAPSMDVVSGHASGVGAVAFLDNGRRLASGGVDGSVRIWDRSTQRGFALSTGHGPPVAALAASPDGRVLAVGYGDRTTAVWDLPSRRRFARLVRTDGDQGNALAFSPDGRLLAWWGDGSTVRLWGVRERRQVGVLRGHRRYIRAIVFSPDGKTVAAGAAGGPPAFVLWEVASRRVLFSSRTAPGEQRETEASAPPSTTPAKSEPETLDGHDSAIFAMALSPDGRWLATGGYDYAVRVWDMGSRQIVAVLKGYSDEIDWLGFTRDGKTLITSSQPGFVKFWSTASWQEAASFQNPRLLSQSVALSPDGSALATGRIDGTIQLWLADPLPSSPPGGSSHPAQQ
jgi:WD40 repeat protein